MGKQYYKDYKLSQDTPTHQALWPLKWSGSKRRYYFYKASTYGYNEGKPDIGLDYNGQSFTIEQIEAKPDWFVPTGKPQDLVPAFPTKEEIEQYAYLTIETRLNDDIDICRCMQELFNSPHWNDALYEFVKAEYNEFHGFNESNHEN